MSKSRLEALRYRIFGMTVVAQCFPQGLLSQLADELGRKSGVHQQAGSTALQNFRDDSEVVQIEE